MEHDWDTELDAIAGGDAEAFARWLAAVEHTLRSSLRSFAARVDVEAVLQEALLRTWNVAPRVTRDGKPNSLFRVSLRIARNLAIDESRRLHTQPVALEEETLATLGAETTPHFLDLMLLSRVRECHERLPDQPRRALAARIESQGAEPDEVLAQRLAMRLNTLLQNFTRARKLLALCLEKLGIDVEKELA